MVKNGIAVDITSANDVVKFKLNIVEGWLEDVGYSSGIYGCNGRLLKGHNSGKLYAITARTSAIFVF